MKYDGLLVTFGCSWTYGAGLNYEPGMKLEDYKPYFQNSKDADAYSFRTILSKRHNLLNINFSEHGSSNQRNIRRAIEFFGSEEFIKLYEQYDNIYVLWGITSIFRTEIFSVPKQKYEKIFPLEPERPIVKTYTEHQKDFLKYYWNDVFSSSNELKQIQNHIRFFNTLFKSLGITNLWFDTFNSHPYTFDTNSRILFQGDDQRDLMSHMCLPYTQPDKKYHLSIWQKDTNRIDILSKQHLINPYTFHPTKEGHKVIADIIDPHLFNINSSEEKL